jgi:hypothetical protein
MTIQQKNQIKEALKNLRMATKEDIKPKKIDKFIWTARILLEIVLDT